MTADRILRWRPLDGPGQEHCEVTETPEAITVRSVVIGEQGGYAYGARYELRLDPDWTFRTLRLERTDGAVVVLQSDGRGHWTDGENHHLAELEGCIDIDIAATPLTNTLPIRRCRLVHGEPRQFRMAWLPLDTVQPQPDEQIYTRLDDRHCRYLAADGSFEAVLEIDEEGFVVHYPGLFERL
ncbi:MAG TPA: putative glycolipid-binding domain-containing protein [Devosiaceae bacterium]|jgi:hypothetical protein|nr:putative glycolipid-binding domain-containing protein [Devosiaceae bacterium]